MAPLIVTGILSLVTKWVGNKQKKQQAIHEQTIKTIESTDSWEASKGSSWTQEWFSLLLSIPMFGAFIPDMVPYIVEGFTVLETMPDYYKAYLGAAMATAFGIKALSKWGGK
jgi:hypothetical protein